MAADSPLLTQTLHLATITGWRRVHNRPAMTTKGWRTALTGDPGFPDLTLAKHKHVVFLEIKPEKGYPTIDQLRWLQMLPGSHIVRPSNWDAIQCVLTGRDPLALDHRAALTWHIDGWHGKLADWATKQRLRGDGW
jgi:hypothetical protein